MLAHMRPENLPHTTAPSRRLEQVSHDTSPDLAVVGVHGGAGASTLARLVSGWEDSHQSWWITTTPQRTLLCARTHASGLQALSDALREWASGSVAIDLVGVALIPDAPGRLPKPLRHHSKIVAGAAPQTWWLEYVDDWRIGQYDIAVPRSYRRLINAITH